ncbi:MAG: PorP/SprF family type IX secretion system membrane protein [Chitinophagaceae bacterium]|nr:PorP/SprF family type IX secretion system membrane protein [Chitinophagaceae bacterium]
MISKRTISRVSLAVALAFTMQGTQHVQAQDVHFTQFNAAPLILNPAFTGNFDGKMRASAIYRDQWRSVTVPFKTIAISVDAPIVHELTTDDYLSAGIQLYNDKAGDAGLTNLSALASVAYTKFLGSNDKTSLSVGFQGGYTQKSFDLSKLYFDDNFIDGQFQPGSTTNTLNNKVDYFVFNAGLAWAQAVGENFSYVIGLGANNLNQPRETFDRKKDLADVGLGMRYNGQVGAIAYVSEKLSLRPAFLYQQQANATEMIAGNEFHLIVGDPEFRAFTTAVFAGAWYRFDDAAMITAGLEFKGFRLGLAYDYTVSTLKNNAKSTGGFELALTWIAPNPLDFAHKLIYPCSRF